MTWLDTIMQIVRADGTVIAEWPIGWGMVRPKGGEPMGDYFYACKVP